MKACRVHRFGPPEVIVFEDVDPPAPQAREVLVRVIAAGVGPWDALVRSGRSGLPQPLPLTLGADIAGVVEAIGSGVSGLTAGQEVFGVSNARFTDGYAEYSIKGHETLLRLGSITFSAPFKRFPSLIFLITPVPFG